MSRSKEKAVALKYNLDEDAAPVVIASGYGSIAEKIIQIAEQKGIPVFRDDSAASLLCMLEVGSNIPEELYEVIAAIYCQLLQTAAEIKHMGAPESPIGRITARGRQISSRRVVRSSPVPAPEQPEASPVKGESEDD